MTKISMPETLTGQSLDIGADKRRQLKSLFPGAFTETRNAEGTLVESIDFERLKAELGTFSEVFESRKERFGLDWPGKSDCMKVMQQPSNGTLLPMRAESVNFDTSENLIIEGDNLEVLKLLQKSYYGKVKMIYIDPPYNTGNEFIYPDNFREGLEEYLRFSGQVDAEGRKQSTNTESSGRYHSNWLSMMYPRLFLAKNLLREDGVIFVSIDDHEAHNLRHIMDDIFGSENFLACIAWEKRYTRSNNAKLFYSLKDSILVYRKSEATESLREQRTSKSDEGYKNPDNDPRGSWTTSSYVNPATKSERPNLSYEIYSPDGRKISHPTHAWKYGLEEHKRHINENRLWWGRDGGASYPRLKIFLSDTDGMVPIDLWDYQSTGTTDDAGSEIKSLFDGILVFDTPKPTKLIRRMLSLVTSKDSNDIILDFFSGSGSTGNAVIDQNESDNGNRRYILVQIPEAIAGVQFKNIAEITRARTVRAGKKLTKNPGFRAFKLAASNFKVWASDPAHVSDLGKSLQLFADHVTPGSQAEDILYELLLKAGYPLTATIEKLLLAGKEVFAVSEGRLLICLDRRLTLDVIDAMVARTPAMILCLDDGFRGNDQLKVNAVQTVKSHNQNNETDIVFRVV